MARFVFTIANIAVSLGTAVFWEFVAWFMHKYVMHGVGDVLFHDIMFHKRIKTLKLTPKAKYLKRIIKAHRIHHSTITRTGATNFGFL
ncbi:MAG: hypothetical protein ACLFR1_09515 [Spirochaetia bacterium]